MKKKLIICLTMFILILLTALLGIFYYLYHTPPRVIGQPLSEDERVFIEKMFYISLPDDARIDVEVWDSKAPMQDMGIDDENAVGTKSVSVKGLSVGIKIKTEDVADTLYKSEEWYGNDRQHPTTGSSLKESFSKVSYIYFDSATKEVYSENGELQIFKTSLRDHGKIVQQSMFGKTSIYMRTYFTEWDLIGFDNISFAEED